jgi:hypothetical protein
MTGTKDSIMRPAQGEKRESPLDEEMVVSELCFTGFMAYWGQCVGFL